ncbi:unnamed protein product [Sphenostylis stenocarpa]|uniref:Cytochrome P450 n=1 Tax=Sphenostylis stenocarpa TaxID=92480 RepID=A0AA86VH65_9FABA|nr:unnamed protein product [Sphenostylis stenocarpa]
MAPKQCPFEQMKGVFSSTFYLSLFFFISVLLLLKLTRKNKSKTNLNQPPSPPKLPIIGNLHQLGTLPHRSLRNLALKYGGMMMLQLGQRQTPTLVVSSAEVAMEITKNHDIAFSNRPHNTAVKILLYGGKDVGFEVYGEDWRQKRKICVVQFLSMKMVQSFGFIREEEVAELVRKLREASCSDAPYVNLSEMILSTSLNIIYKCLFGRQYSGDSDGRVKKAVKNIMIQITAFSVRDYFPLLGFVDDLTGKIGEFKATFEALDAVFDKAIEEHLTAKAHSQKETFLNILLQLQGHTTLTRNDVKALIMDMFIGATETTAVALEWSISELVRNPRIMKKAQEEVREVVGHKAKVEGKDMSGMQYLKCVIKETLRLHPPAPLLAVRETISSVKLNGYDIPAKTMVYINAWAIQRDPKFWENPEEFLPERFESSKVDFKGQDFEFIPFGIGRRGCPGINFGLASVEYLLANLLYWFDWKLPNTEPLDMSEIFGLVASRKTPLNLKPMIY